MDLDNKDFKILEELKQDSRKSIKDISKKTKIRPSTVHQRIQKLVKNNVIEKFTIKLNDRAVKEDFIVFMLVKGGTSEYIDNKILANMHVKEIFGITGEYDLLIKLKFENIGKFNDFILKFRKENKDIHSTLTMVTTANLKEEI